MLDESVQDEAARSPMLDESVQDEAARPPMLAEAVQDEAARSPMLTIVLLNSVASKFWGKSLYKNTLLHSIIIPYKNLPHRPLKFSRLKSLGQIVVHTNW